MEAAFKGYVAFMAVWAISFLSGGRYVAFAGRAHGDDEGVGIFVMGFLTLAVAVSGRVWLISSRQNKRRGA